MTIRLILFSLTLLFGLVAFEQAQAQSKKKNKNKNKKEINQDLENPGSLIEINENTKSVAGETSDIAPKQILAEQSLIEGMKWYMLEEYTKATAAFEAALKIDDKNDAACYQLALCYFRLGEPRSALPHAEMAAKIKNENIYYLQLLASVYQDLSDNANAEKTWRTLIQKQPRNDEYYHSLADLLRQAGKTKDAIKVYDQAEAIIGPDDEMIRKKQDIYLNAGNLDAALKEGQKLIDAFPDFPDYMLMQAELMLNNRRVEDGKTIIQKYLNSGFSHPYAYLMLADIAANENDNAAQFKYLQMAFEDRDLNPEQKVRILLTNYYEQAERNNSLREQGLNLSQAAAKAHPESADLLALHGDFLYISQKQEEALSIYLQSVAINPDNFRVWERILQIDWNASQTDKLVEHGAKATDLFPNQALAWFYYGMGLSEAQKNDEALEALEQGRALAVNNKELISNFEALIGDLYHQTKDYPKSDRAYEAALTANPNNARALNNYSYYLALRKENLNFAQQMSIKLVRLYPNDANYLDTHAWVLYVLGSYEQARTYMEKAIALGSPSATLLEHYGDILFKLGNVEAALSQWIKALQIDTDNQALEQKIKNKRLE